MKHKICIDVDVSGCWEVECAEIDDKDLELFRCGKVGAFNLCRDIEVFCSSCYPAVWQDGKEINVDITDDMYKVERLNLAEWCKREHLAYEDYSGNLIVRVSDADICCSYWNEEDTMPEWLNENAIETDDEFDPGKLKILVTRVYVGDDYFEIAEGVEYDGRYYPSGSSSEGTVGVEVECVVNAETGEIVVRRY